MCYGDIVPLHGEVRMLAALEGITGIPYVAITVASISECRHEWQQRTTTARLDHAVTYPGGRKTEVTERHESSTAPYQG
jgi:hypothetical protein